MDKNFQVRVDKELLYKAKVVAGIYDTSISDIVRAIMKYMVYYNKLPNVTIEKERV